jgi:hypothetical protein
VTQTLRRLPQAIPLETQVLCGNEVLTDGVGTVLALAKHIMAAKVLD